MARNDGRVEKGQSIRSAFSAKAWNRAQDAADIVLGGRPSITAGPVSTVRLPCLAARFPEKGFFGEVRVPGQNIFPDIPNISPSVPASVATASSFSDNEKRFLSLISVPTQQSYAGMGRDDSPFIVCISNDDNLYAISGMAITRVRVFNYRHRYARLPQLYDGIDGLNISEAVGCMDSSFFGPAKVIGYARFDASSFVDLQFRHCNPAPPLVWPNYQVRWALISF